MSEYQIVYSRRRTLSLQVTREGKVVVRAPYGLPKARIDSFVAQHRDWLDSHLARQRAWREAHPEPTEEEEQRLRALAREVLPRRVAHYAPLMGVEPTGVKITSAKSRFGSCSGKNSICFSWRLMAYPPEAVDYVVVHELAHIIHKNHGPAFYRCVEAVLPDWRQRRALLKG